MIDMVIPLFMVDDEWLKIDTSDCFIRVDGGWLMIGDGMIEDCWLITKITGLEKDSYQRRHNASPRDERKMVMIVDDWWLLIDD